jgi:hypothetical protein
MWSKVILLNIEEQFYIKLLVKIFKEYPKNSLRRLSQQPGVKTEIPEFRLTI